MIWMVTKMVGRTTLAALALTATGFAQSPTQTDPAQPDPAQTEVTPDTLIRPASEVSLDSLLWKSRAVVVFADSPNDPRFVEQLGLITDRLSALAERDVMVITDTEPRARSDVRRSLRARGFMLVVLAKDGSVVIRKPAPWDVREISRSIDKLPLRQQEVRDRRTLSGT